MELQFKIQKVNIEENKRIIVVSDIHGMDHYLEGVLQKVQYTTEDVLVIVGDVIAEGDKLSVIEETTMGYIVKKQGVIGWYVP